jgi:hypothetical protein
LVMMYSKVSRKLSQAPHLLVIRASIIAGGYS